MNPIRTINARIVARIAKSRLSVMNPPRSHMRSLVKSEDEAPAGANAWIHNEIAALSEARRVRASRPEQDVGAKACSDFS